MGLSIRIPAMRRDALTDPRLNSREWHAAFTLAGMALFFLLVISGCATHGNVPYECEIPVDQTTYSFDQGTYPSPLDLFPKYHIAPGDILDVFYQIRRVREKEFRITLYDTVSVTFVDLPQLSTTQKVLPDGTITLPYIGPIEVVGKTVSEVSATIKAKYRGILRDPSFYVSVPEFTGRVDQLREDLRTAPRGLSKLITVRPDGYATFPLIGEVLVARKTVLQVNEILQKRYEQVLPGMQVDLFLHQASGSSVYVLGEVQNPGTYEIMRPISILEALTLAGGFTNKAELRSVIVYRKHERKHIAKKLNVKDLMALKQGSTFFYLRPNDVVYIPKTYIGSLGEFMRQVGDIFLFNGITWGDDIDWVD
jgi:polysaccharide export outer membrane protein